MKQEHVLVIGSGVAGLTTAYHILCAGHGTKVTIWSKENDESVPATSGNAYALWVPYKDDLDHRIEGWSDHSLKLFQTFAQLDETGVALRPIINLQTQKSEPWYAGKYAFFRHPISGEIPAEYADGWVLDGAPVINPKLYMPWLKSMVQSMGAVFAQVEVSDFDDVPAQFDLVVNCTGSASEQLAGDEEISPFSLQVVTVKNNGLDRVLVDDVGPNALACAVPHGDYIKLGAVTSESEGDAVDDLATLDILERCSKILPPDLHVSAKDVLDVVRAPRPNRDRPRVEADELADGRTIIHNYGHGSTGYITSHGIGQTIADHIAMTIL